MTRRDFLSTTIAHWLSFAFLRARCKETPAMMMLMEPICFHMFRAAEAANDRSTPTWHHTREMQEETGLTLAAGRELFSHLLYGSGSQFEAWRSSILWELPEYLGFPAGREWLRLHPYLDDIFGQFFGHAKVRSWPTLVWIMPAYVSTGYSPGLWKVKPKDRVLKHAAFNPRVDSVSRFRLHFNPGTEHPSLDLDLRSVPLANSHRHGMQSGQRVLWMNRQRSGILQNGKPLSSAFEQNLGLAEPDDDAGSLADGYYPAHDGLRVTDGRGRTLFIRFRVLVLARAKPICDWYHGVVDQIVISFDPRSACSVDFNIVGRDIELFLRHYPGLRPLICQALGLGGFE